MIPDASYYVYIYFRLDGTPCYVGKGKGGRWLHRGKWGRNKHFIHLHEQAMALGKELPKIKIAENLSEDDALKFEATVIATIGREIDGGPLVNLSIGGERGPVGYKFTPEQREAHGAIRRGKKHSPEWRAAIARGLAGKPKSHEHGIAVGLANRGKTKSSGWWSTEEGRDKQRSNNPRYGAISPHSDETKLKIKQARKLQTNFGGLFQKGHAPSEDTRAKLSASTTALWAKRRAIHHSQEGIQL